MNHQYILLLAIALVGGCKKTASSGKPGLFSCEKMTMEASRECKKRPPDGFCKPGCTAQKRAFCFSVHSNVTNSRVWICSPTKEECGAWRESRKRGQPSSCLSKTVGELP